MTEKEIAEIRRRFKTEKSNISHVIGCYVNEKNEIISQFSQSLNLMPEEESEKVLATLKKTLSGTAGKNLTDISFSTQQVVDSDEHRLLMQLRHSGLQDEASVQKFFETAISAINMQTNYLILLAFDRYDVPFRSKDGEKFDDASSEVFSYILCSVCPIKMTKPALSFYPYNNEFKNCTIDCMVSAPEIGFMFPCFDERSTNIYNALYYSKNIKDNHQDFANSIFNVQMPLPPAQQKATFQALIEDSFAEDCNYELVQAVTDKLCKMVMENKEDKEALPLQLSKASVKNVLQSCGATQQHTDTFEQKYDTNFGEDTNLHPCNIVNINKVEIKTSQVSISVRPEDSELVQTKIIDGVKYIMVKVEDGVEINGINVEIN